MFRDRQRRADASPARRPRVALRGAVAAIGAGVMTRERWRRRGARIRPDRRESRDARRRLVILIQDIDSPVETPMRRVVTHSKPDGDTIASAWLAATYMLLGEHLGVAFVPPACLSRPPTASSTSPAPSTRRGSSSTIPSRRPSGTGTRPAPPGSTGSTSRRSADVGALVRGVHGGDCSPPVRPSAELARSRSEGFHGDLSRMRASCDGDQELYRAMQDWRDDHDRRATSPRSRCCRGGSWTCRRPGDILPLVRHLRHVDESADGGRHAGQRRGRRPAVPGPGPGDHPRSPLRRMASFAFEGNTTGSGGGCFQEIDRAIIWAARIP